MPHMTKLTGFVQHKNQVGQKYSLGKTEGHHKTRGQTHVAPILQHSLAHLGPTYINTNWEMVHAMPLFMQVCAAPEAESQALMIQSIIPSESH